MNAAQTNAYVFLIQCFCNRTGYRCLTSSRRSHQTEDRTLTGIQHLADCQKFQNTLFDFFQSIVLLFQNIFRHFQIQPVFASLVPRKIQQCLNIAAAHRCLCRIKACIQKSLDLFLDPLLHFIRSFQLLYRFTERLRFCIRAIIAQFLPDHLHLLPQIIFLLLLIYPRFYLFLHASAISFDLNLIIQGDAQHLVTCGQALCLQQTLLLLPVKGRMYHNLCDHILQGSAVQHLTHQFLTVSAGSFAVGLKDLLQITKHGFLSNQRQIAEIFRLRLLHLSIQILTGLKFHQSGPEHTFHQYP